ncbi:tetratricopeptide repeat protein [Streptomyces sp. NPDC002688]|uniref:tetratricopeptide repeat protein n=1 Tax=Streptomyces sp. NPDC002688 TaxID=3154423 RepID=UPI0033216A9F
MGTERELYRVDTLPLRQASLTVEQARAQPAQLLQARHALVDFTGRRAELEQLAAWRDGADAASVLLLHGIGGQGKTRLGAHFAQSSSERGWQVFQARHASDPAPSSTDQSGLAADRPGGGVGAGTLLIADYAERWPTADLLTMLSDATLQGGPARVLLLARPAGLWWQTLAYRLDRLGLPATALPLLPLADDPDTDPDALFAAARNRFAAALDIPGARNIPPPEALRDDPGFRQALSVHMAALATVDAHPAAGRALLDTPERVTAYLLTRERDHWQTLHANHRVRTTADTLAHAVYTAALTGAVPYDHGRAALADSGVCLADQANQVLTDHAVSYPSASPHTVLEPLYPDRLAEDFLALTTPGHTMGSFAPDPWAATAPQRLLAATASPSASPTSRSGAADTPVWARTAVIALISAAARWPHLTTGQLAPLLTAHPRLMLHAGGAALTALAALEHLPIDVLERVDGELSESRDTDLDPGAAALAARLTRHRLAATSVPAEHARVLHRLEARQWRAGLHPQAVATSQQVVDIWRNLAQSNPAAYEPDLASSLSNLGVHLGSVGRHAEGLATEQEAVAIRRRLAQDNPTTHGHHLAESLINLALRLDAIGRRAEALATTERVIPAYRQLADTDPATYEPGLATALNNLGSYLAKAGRHEDALDATEEAIDIRRRLAQDNPTTHGPALAISLNNLGIHLAAAERRAEALAAAEEAVQVDRQLAEAIPAAYEPDLATALHNLSIHLAGAGLPEDALNATEQAVTIRRRLARRLPAAHEPDLARSLGMFARIRVELRRDLPAALEAAQESVEIYRHLAQAEALAYDTDLRTVLDVQADILDRLGRTEPDGTPTTPP